MEEISEQEWISAINNVKKERDKMLTDSDLNFRDLLDNEIVTKLLEGGLKICQDEKNK
jgi:hypothetical protein